MVSYAKRYSSTHHNDVEALEKQPKVTADGTPDFIKLAEAYGAEGFRVFNEEDLSEALKKADAVKDGPVIIDCIIEPEANVFPMVPPGAGLKEMIFNNEGNEEK